MSLFRNRKPKVTEFQLAELLEKCKEDPGRFLEEYKNTPVFVVGTVKRFMKAVGLEAGLFVVMEAGAKEEGKFVIAAPESQVVKGQELKVKVYILQITICYDRDMIEESISIEGYPERIEDGLQQRFPISKEEEIFVVPAHRFLLGGGYVTYRCHTYNGFDTTYDKTLIAAEWYRVEPNEDEDRTMIFLFDSYLKKSELAPIFGWKDYSDNVKIKGRREEESTYRVRPYRVRRCKILGMQKISQERR